MILAAVTVAVCATCHPDVAAQWAQSAHRFSSFNNPYYALSANAFRRERGEAAFVFCARCHDPALVAAGRIGAPFSQKTPEAQAGIACLVCHSVTEAHVRGNGGYRLTRRRVPFPPAILDHDERVRPSLLESSQFCAACHKVALAPEVTHDIWLRGQNDYDPWQMSALAGQGAGAVRRPPETRRCQDCHMPLEPAPLGDRAAQNGQIRSHRFLAANAALPLIRGDLDAVGRVEAFLRGAVSVDVVASQTSGDLTADVVLRNRRTGHRFPGGTNDSNEVWIELEVLDEAGAVVARAGGLDDDGNLTPDTHLIRAQPVDGAGEPLSRRDPQHMRGVAYDTSLSPSDPQVIRYRLTPAPAGPLRVRARVLYRKFSAAYARAACKKCVLPPVVEVATATRAPGDQRDWEAWLDHGLGLADGLVERAAEALPSLERARASAPTRVEPLIGLCRLALAEGRTEDVLALAAQAERLAPDHPAPLYLAAQALARAFRYVEAQAPLERLVARLPADRGVWLAAGRARSVAGEHAGALEAAERVLAIDPESYDGHHLRMLALEALGRRADATGAERAYLYYRRRHERDLALRAAFCRRHPERAQEPYGAHEHPVHLETRRRAMSVRKISLVPSPTVNSGASR